MVISSKTENEPSPFIKILPAEGIPFGNYQLVGWDMDSTGRKLIDEICQIAAYTPNSTFSQYVMPFKNLTLPARKRHNLRVATIGKYRMLKDGKTNKVIKTKSEISAIIDFLDWLEIIKSDTKDGIILIYHESRKVNPSLLIDTLIKYDLLDRFKKIVKGFANGFDIANNKCAGDFRSFSLRSLSRNLLKQDEEWGNAATRARLAYQIIHYLCEDNIENAALNKYIQDSNVTSNATIEFICKFVQPTDAEERDLEELKLTLKRQHTLKPLFDCLLQMTRRERKHASPLRRLLAEAKLDYIQLKNAWSIGQEEALTKLIKENVDEAVGIKLENLLMIIRSHFDPTKKLEIKIDDERGTKGSKKSQEKSKSMNSISPDTTTLSSPIKINNMPTFEVEAQ